MKITHEVAMIVYWNIIKIGPCDSFRSAIHFLLIWKLIPAWKLIILAIC